MSDGPKYFREPWYGKEEAIYVDKYDVISP